MTNRRHLRFGLPLIVLTAIALVAASAALALAARSRAATIGTGVVVVETNLAYQDSEAAGTGIVLTSSGEILTNNHVIDGATTIKVIVPSAVPGTGHSYTAQVVGYTATSDVAVLQLVRASNLTTATIGDSSKLTIGAAVTAVGNAGGTGVLTTATGKITGLGKSITAGDGEGNSENLHGLIETNAGVRPGDSGGPLEDASGNVVGMDTAAASSYGYQSVSSTDAYAIPIASALKIAKQIESGVASATVHIGGTAFLGVEVSPTPQAGALVAAVVPNGAAASAGLVAGDVITAVNGHVVRTAAVVSKLISPYKPGTTITVTYLDQSGASQTATVKLASGPPR
jgi:S1-C subfamily serine protease